MTAQRNMAGAGAHRDAHRDGFPWKHVIGFILSLILTFAAVWFVFSSSLSKTAILSFIIMLALLQAGLQLFMFMHLTEGHNSRIQTGAIIYGFFVAITVVVGSIWVMSFGMY